MPYLLPPEYLEYLDYLPDLQKCANIFISFTPLFSYGTTCYGIYTKKTSMGFSIDICATMLMSSILRIFYYIITPYEISLLRQSIVMVFIQSLLLKISLNYRPKSFKPEYLEPLPSFKNELNSYLPRHLSVSTYPTYHETYATNGVVESIGRIADDYYVYMAVYLTTIFRYTLNFFDVHYKRPKLFWQWNDESDYWKYILKFSLIFGVLTAIFNHNETYGSFIGVLGLFIEALLPLPQILMLNRLKSIRNFKIMLLLSWLGGDLTKISYLVFGTDNISIIFILAALFQMGLDIIIAFQYLHFRNYQLSILPTANSK
ncbi:DEHA2D12870p [Debaryomyces hansenii CBS767]|uniref:DEHA2D12870p n=1 Tax=Debaryomyces hansenii (strain ATCC 36239 / CBS 767 / BCRC 21394 / JCM 1990 / NBRC 0083 / IGC 2968) TaxID=284592 RepID=Q6BRY7_DEBHA|nr:DEHA2D12870p [Debaryomyces hansenii CBS767]CAG87201.2 DEHA2D12870p [Debaryomyces hansenii CBS767]|eukprot:XP_459033.2 DEHA2D12870p [Debaryomyces hansenii CBS767]